jgi:molybdopterin converting factor small subunit
MISSVNYKQAKSNQKLRNGDTVTFLAPLSGG